jgi:predicted DNA-binding transcriptional regulator AlpA
MRSSGQTKPVQFLHGTPPSVSSGHVTVTPSNTASPDKLLRVEDVMELTKMGRSSIYSRPGFPARIRFSSRCARWRESEILAYIASCKTVVEQAQ